MATPRPTFQQRLFSDEDLPLPLHDQIVRWTDLALRNRLHPILDALTVRHRVDDVGVCFGWGQTHYESNVNEHDQTAYRASLWLSRKLKSNISIPPSPKIEARFVKWEPILKDDRGTIVGAVDLHAEIRITSPELTLFAERETRSLDVLTWTKGLTVEKDDFLVADHKHVWANGRDEPLIDLRPILPVGIIAIIITRSSCFLIKRLEWSVSKYYFDDINLFVEAKTKIRSAGELLRQINLYKSVVRSNSRFLVIAPASAWEPEMRDILAEQGVATLNYMAN